MSIPVHAICAFTVIRLLKPFTKEEYYEKNYGRLLINITKGYKKKNTDKRIEFLGGLVVCSPMFEIEGPCTITEYTNHIQIKPQNKKSVFKYTKINSQFLTHDNINSFILELKGAAIDKKHTDEMYALLRDGICSVNDFKKLNCFTELDMEHRCEYFRVDFEVPLHYTFPTKRAIIRKMPPADLVKAHHLLTHSPWYLCFEKHTKPLGLCEVEYTDFEAIRRKVKTPPLFILAIRIYSYLKKQRSQGHEIFVKEAIFTNYHNDPKWRRSGDEVYQAGAIELLMYHALQYVDNTKMYVAFFKDVAINVNLRIALKRLEIHDNPNEVLVRGELVPWYPSTSALTRQQNLIMKHIETNRITLVTGGAGTGKTEILVSVMAKYSNVLVVTFVGSMVDSLIQHRFDNRTKTAHTIHHIIAMYYHVSGAYEKWLSEYDILVIDEGANNSSKEAQQLLSIMTQCVKKLVIVGDTNQIYPIKPGCPFRDLIAALPQHTFELTENKRVEKNSRLLADASALIPKGMADKIVFEGPLQLVTRPATEEEQFVLFKDLLLKKVKTSQDIMKLQIITLRNKDRKMLNKWTEDVLIEKKILKKPLTKTFALCNEEYFPGKKIQFLKNTEPVRNGELGQIKSIKMVDSSHHLIVLTNGKKIKVADKEGFVSPFNITSGYATTCNKAQGSEWPSTIFWLYESPKPFFTREYAYVAISRAKLDCTVVAKHRNEFLAVCSRAAQARQTLLAYYLHKEPEILSTLIPYENIPYYGDKVDISKLSLIPHDVPIVPVMPNTTTKNKKEGNNNDNDYGQLYE
jgi:hypothetical protein